MKKSILVISVLVVISLVWTFTALGAGKPKKVGQEEHWVAYNDGTVLDTKTNLMWPSKSSKPMNWNDAKKYADTFSGGGYKDWRQPTASELETLMDPWLKNPRGYKLTKFIDIQECCPWSSDKKPGDKKDQYRKAYDFSTGAAFFATQINDQKNPSLPVRKAKK